MDEAGRLSPMGDESFDSFALYQASLVGKRLSVTTYPGAGEGLPGLLFRAASENGYPTAGVFNDLLGISSAARFSHNSISDVITDPHRLADILGLRAHHIIPLLYPVTRPTRTHVTFFGREVRRGSFFESWRRVSPISLRANCYEKAIWSVSGITFDPKTRETLLFSCRECDNPLSYQFTSGVEYCALCMRKGVTTDLRLETQPIVRVNDEEALEFAISLIDPEVNVENLDQSLIPEELRPFGPGPIFELIVSMAHAKNAALSEETRSAEPFAKRLTPTAADLGAAARAILDWPEGFFQYADSLRFHHNEKYKRRADPEFLHLRNRWRDPISEVVAGLDREMREKILSTAQATRKATLYEAVGRLMSDSENTVSPSDLDAKVWQLKNRKSGLRQMYAAADLCRKVGASIPPAVGTHLMLSSSKSVRDFSTSVGIPVPFIGDLIRDNVVEEFEPVMERILGRNGTAPVESLEARIKRIASDGHLPAHALTLADACSAISRRRTNPWSGCLQAIIAGQIPVQLVQRSTVPLVGRLYVLEYGRLRSILETLPDRHDLLQIPADVRTVSSVLGLSKGSILYLRRPGMLQDNLTMSGLWSFRHIFISVAEVQRRLAFNDIHLDTKVINKQLDAVGIERIGFSRKRQPITVRNRQAVETFYGQQLAAMV